MSAAKKHLKLLFGTAGASESYRALKHKDITRIPEYLAGFGLNAFEYQCGRGVRVNKSHMETLRVGGEEQGITYSLHAPYYISMSSMEEEKRLNSLRYIQQSAEAVKLLGGRRVIFHSGSCGKQSREEAMEKALDTMRRIVEMLDREGHGDIVVCPETMGKMSQLGTVEEVMELCGIDKRITPCLDLGHINARTQGGLAKKEDFARVLDTLESKLGDERAKTFHVHFSKIEYSKGGEKRHLTFADQTYGPRFEPFLELCYERGLTPHIICESDGTQAEDAATMMKYYKKLK